MSGNDNHTWTPQRHTATLALFESFSAEFLASKPTTDVAHLDSPRCHIKNANSFSAATIISISRKCHVCWSAAMPYMISIECCMSSVTKVQLRYPVLGLVLLGVCGLTELGLSFWQHKEGQRSAATTMQRRQPCWKYGLWQKAESCINFLLPEKWPPQISPNWGSTWSYCFTSRMMT